MVTMLMYYDELAVCVTCGAKCEAHKARSIIALVL